MTQYYLEKMPDRNKIRIDGQVAGFPEEVYLPLPDDFGFTVGSEFTTPFDTGGASGTLQKLYALGNISNKMGLSIKNMYSNPTPTEISFEAELAAYESPVEEVIVPALKLMGMGLGTKFDADDFEDLMRKIEDSYGTTLFGGAGSSDSDDRMADRIPDTLKELIFVIQGPKTCDIHFGNVYTIWNAYITSVSPQFSNKVDENGTPLYAKVSITATVERFPTADDVYTWFRQDNIQE